MPVGQSLRKPLYHCFSSCSLNSVLLTRSSSISGASLLLCLPMAAPGRENAQLLHTGHGKGWYSQVLLHPTCLFPMLEPIHLVGGCSCTVKCRDSNCVTGDRLDAHA